MSKLEQMMEKLIEVTIESAKSNKESIDKLMESVSNLKQQPTDELNPDNVASFDIRNNDHVDTVQRKFRVAYFTNKPLYSDENTLPEVGFAVNKNGSYNFDSEEEAQSYIDSSDNIKSLSPKIIPINVGQ